MSYDFHGAWEDFTGMNSPLYSRSDEAPEFRQWNIVSYRNNYSVWTLKIRQ
jgi:GH18 family chitinase